MNLFAACNGRPSPTLTRATNAQRLDINQLIQKVDFESAAKNEKISTFAVYKDFRLDNERPAGDFAKFRIQSGKLTYCDVLIKIGKKFGVKAIRNAFVKSCFCGQIFTLE